jgi:hypothetical protein
MARDAQLTAKVRVDGARQAQSDLDDLAQSAQDLEEPVELTVDAKVTAAIQQLQDLVTEAKQAQTAAEALGQSLGPELSGKVNLDELVVGFEKAGLSLDQITAKADELGASLRDVAGPAGENLDALGKRAAATSADTDKLSDSARGANSALANMVGNSAQDLGAVGGLAGSAGVAIGQMAEYASDAALAGESMGAALKSMAAVAGPIAALGLATQLVSSQLQAMSKGQEASKAFRADDIKAFTDALRSGGSAVDAYADHLRDAGKVMVSLGPAQGTPWWANLIPGASDLTGALGFLGKYGDALTDLTGTLDKAGITVQQWSQIVESSTPTQTIDKLRDALARMNLTDDERAHILEGARTAQDNYAQAQDNAGKIARVFGTNSEEAAKSAQELAREQEEAAKAARDHAIALSGANDTLLDTLSTFNEMARKGDALSSIFDLSSSALESASKVRDITSSIGELKDAAKGVKLSDALDTSDIHFDKVLDAFDQLRPQVQAKIVEAFQTGGSQAAQDTADNYVQQIVTALGGKLSPEKVKELLGIGDLETTLKVALDQSTAAKVKSELAVLTGLSGETPLTASIQLALDAGLISPAAAQALVQAQLGAAGVTVPLDPVTDPAALAEASAFMTAYVAGHPATLPIGGDNSGAVEATQEAAKTADKTTGTVTVDGNRKPADQATTDAAKKADSTTGTIKVDASTALAAAVLLAFIAQPRVANVYANVPNLGVANSALNGLTGARTAPVYAEARNVSQANAQINAIANQQRTARIDVSVVPTSVLVRVNGGG